MNNGVKFVVLFLLLFSFSHCKKTQTNVLYDRQYIEEIKATREDLFQYMTGNFIPGGNFAIAKEGKLIYSEGMGLASKDLEVPVTRETKFRIGDVSEIFTALIYHKMIEEGTLHPDSTVQFYLPDFPEKEYPLPIYHLINHASGIREPYSSEENWQALNVSLQKGLDQFREDSLIIPPGIYQISSFFNYNLLGAIMENVTGKRIHEILKEYVTDTLGLEHTVTDNPFITIKGRAAFYDHNYISQVVNATFKDMRYKAPSRGLLSTAEDLVRFGNAFLYSGYFPDKLKQNLILSDDLDYDPTLILANGWSLLEDRTGRVIYGRTGSVTGGSAAILVYPEEELVVACATNLTADLGDFPVFSMSRHFLTWDEPE